MTPERRTITADEIRLEQNPDGSRRLVGHAAVFDQLSKPIRHPNIRERVDPGAFSRALREDDVRALWNHSPDFVLGRTKSGTLQLEVDGKGLRIECDLPDTQLVNDMVVAPIERGDVTEMSFGFTVRDGGERWERADDGCDVRVLTDVVLYDVSPCAFAAYEGTEVLVRSWEGWKAEDNGSHPAVEQRGDLRDPGEILAISAKGALALQASDEPEPAGDEPREPEPKAAGALAVLRIDGPTQKRSDWFSAGTQAIREQLLALGDDPDVSGILLVVDSPGGQAAGTDELAQAVAQVNQRKPVHVYGQDTVASAAVWYSSQAGRITMNRMGEFGSIGTYAVLSDWTGMLKRAGIKLHVVSSGGEKGLGADLSVPKELVDRVQESVDRITGVFVESVASGRGLDVGKVRKLATGTMWPADEALDLGLIDGVGTEAEALAALQAAVDAPKKVRNVNAQARQMLAERELAD